MPQEKPQPEAICRNLTPFGRSNCPWSLPPQHLRTPVAAHGAGVVLAGPHLHKRGLIGPGGFRLGGGSRRNLRCWRRGGGRRWFRRRARRGHGRCRRGGGGRGCRRCWRSSGRGRGRRIRDGPGNARRCHGRHGGRRSTGRERRSLNPRVLPRIGRRRWGVNATAKKQQPHPSHGAGPKEAYVPAAHRPDETLGHKAHSQQMKTWSTGGHRVPDVSAADRANPGATISRAQGLGQRFTPLTVPRRKPGSERFAVPALHGRTLSRPELMQTRWKSGRSRTCRWPIGPATLARCGPRLSATSSRRVRRLRQVPRSARSGTASDRRPLRSRGLRGSANYRGRAVLQGS